MRNQGRDWTPDRETEEGRVSSEQGCAREMGGAQQQRRADWAWGTLQYSVQTTQSL